MAIAWAAVPDPRDAGCTRCGGLLIEAWQARDWYLQSGISLSARPGFAALDDDQSAYCMECGAWD
jgi:hypothetical protein